MSIVSTSEGLRAALPGELCTCGRPAVDVYVGGRFGDTGGCGQQDGGLPVDGVCTFCGDTIDHAGYWQAEWKAGRETPAVSDEPQGGRCPLYRLRLADPLPAVHPESVRPYDPVRDRRERAVGRLQGEVLEVLIAAGLPFDGGYPLDPDDDPDDPAPTGDLDDVAHDISFDVRQALAADTHDIAGHDPRAGQDAVAVLITALRSWLATAGVTPDPLAGLDADALIERAGGTRAWCETVAHDRPLLIARRVVRRALDPETPYELYRSWHP